jgi:hypothetical protein
MTAGREIDYETLAQDAMRGVVKAVLVRAAKEGLPGEHHFYIAFNTQAPGVVLSKRLEEKYPEEMTIVLQHRFWDLLVSEDRFEVKLTFDSIPERLSIPFAAVKVFFDPSVPYGLQFEESELAGQTARRSYAGGEGEPARGKPVPALPPDEPHTVQRGGESAQRPNPSSRRRTDKAPEPPVTAKSSEERPAKDEHAREPEKAPAPSEGAKVVRIDSFRKK